jgi:beta-phosphoglucomutase-like phosphatase (HAD superfamily)
VPAGFSGAIFDVDGVLVDSPHERAWREALRELLDTSWSDVRAQTTYSPERFTPHVYQQVISGKPRLDGALAALEYFHIPEAKARAEPYAERKQEVVLQYIADGEFTAFPDALGFVLAVRATGIAMAAASSSKNADTMLRQVRLDTFAAEHSLHYDFLRGGLNLQEIFDVDLSGRDLARGKPDPEIFLDAAGELHLPPVDCFVVEDAVAGVQAAKAGQMAALGVARADDAALLAAADADLVVRTLDEVDVEALREGRLKARAR